MAIPRKLALHRRIDDRSVSFEDDPLREEPKHEATVKSLKRQKNLQRQRSLTCFRHFRPGSVSPSLWHLHWLICRCKIVVSVD